MQTCTNLKAMAQCSTQASARKSVAVHSAKYIAIGAQNQRNALAQTPAVRPFGATSLPKRNVLNKVQAASAEVGKLISKVEIPAFIPRTDIMDQLLRWALIEMQENGMANVGCPCKVSTYQREGLLWGFTVSFLKDGVSATDIRVAFDDEITMKYEWVGRGQDGFPILEGSAEEVVGKNFEIRKVDDTAVSEAIRSSVREFCQMLVQAINRYYSFGSCFAEDI